jgi:hypothetical protein
MMFDESRHGPAEPDADNADEGIKTATFSFYARTLFPLAIYLAGD